MFKPFVSQLMELLNPYEEWMLKIMKMYDFSWGEKTNTSPKTDMTMGKQALFQTYLCLIS